MTSFQRQLNLYGFSRITRGLDAEGYYHELFLRGKPYLAENMVRQRIKGTKIKGAANPDEEPDFYSMVRRRKKPNETMYHCVPFLCGLIFFLFFQLLQPYVGTSTTTHTDQFNFHLQSSLVEPKPTREVLASSAPSHMVSSDSLITNETPSRTNNEEESVVRLCEGEITFASDQVVVPSQISIANSNSTTSLSESAGSACQDIAPQDTTTSTILPDSVEPFPHLIPSCITPVPSEGNLFLTDFQEGAIPNFFMNEFVRDWAPPDAEAAEHDQTLGHMLSTLLDDAMLEAL